MAKPTDLVPGHARPLDPTHACAPADARLGNRTTHPASLQGGLAGEPRGAVSRSASPRTTGLGPRQMGRIREQSPRQILFADSGRRQISAPGASAMEATLVSD